MKKAIIFTALIIMGIVLPLYAQVRVGEPAPIFSVTDGYDGILDSDKLKGRVIAGFYEDRYQIEMNRQLKIILTKYYSDNYLISSNNAFMLSVIDASSANFVTRPVWKRTFIKSSRLNRVTVYGDWDGSMKESFGLPDNESTFLIIDKKGVVRYICSGKVPEKYFEGIMDMVGRLCLE